MSCPAEKRPTRCSTGRAVGWVVSVWWIQLAPARAGVNSTVMILLELRSVTVPVLVLLCLVGTVSAQNRNVASPDEVVKSFYRFHFSHDHNFLQRNVQRRESWLSPTLFQLLMNEFRRQEEYGRAHPNSSFVPYMEGDPFTYSSEFPTSFRVGHVFIARTHSVVNVAMFWSGHSSRGKGAKNLEVHLATVGGQWRIDDIVDKDDDEDLVVNLKREKYLP